MAGENHIINKISLQLNGASTQNAFQWQQDMNNYLQYFLPARLEKLLDDHFPFDRWVQIDKLQINIEAGHNFSAKQLQNLIEEELQKQLTKKAVLEGTPKKANEKISPFKAWLFFLETGRLPWWYGPSSISTLEELVIAEWQATPAQSTVLLQEAIHIESVRWRLVLHSSGHLFVALLALLRFTTYEVQQWESTVLEAVEERLEETYKWRQDGYRKKMIMLSIRYAFLQRVVNQRQRSLKIDEEIIQSLVLALEKNAIQPEHLLRNLADRLSGDKMQTTAVTAPNKTAPEKGATHIIVGSAGIVLFHPYLEYFFRALNLLDDTGREIVYPGKAVQLLHYLATGETCCQENETVLHKVLCGIKVNEPLYTQYPVSADEQAECQSLLEAVIRNWPALRNTSPQGLQETFLQRAGKLSRKDDHWLLQVEQKTVDVLLNKLQWPLSVIRLPWMESWLQVEWT